MKTRFALLITMALLAIGLPIPAHAATPFLYAVSDGKATITGYEGFTRPPNMVIPDEITDSDGTYPVTAIGNFAFYNVQLTRLTLPDSLTAIGAEAFTSNQLTELTLPNGLTTIGAAAFAYNQLADLTLPNSLSTIGNGAFNGNQLADLTLPNTLTTIGDTVFSGNQLTELDLPDTLTTIGNWAFSGNQLTELTLPNPVTTIGNYAFRDNRLTELTLPNAVTTIGSLAFGDNQLATVQFTGAAPRLSTEALGTSEPTVRFPWKYGAPRATGGYTTPSWQGHTTIPVAVVSFTGGGDIDTQSIDVDGDAVAAEPADPVKAGHAFTGWYADGANTPFDFSTPITADVSLTAGFDALPMAPALSGPAAISAELGAEVTWEPTTLTGYPAATITATGLPAGLSINETTGAISGKVTDALLARDHTVTITASNGIEPDATLDLTISIEYFTYYVTGNAATIDGYHGTMPTSLVIPAEITDRFGSHPVRTISSQTFMQRGLTELTLPDSLTTIERLAFYENQLTELTLPDSLTTIGSSAFASNPLTELTIGDSLTTIGDNAFIDNQLTELTLPDSLTTIGSSAFMRNPLAELTIGDGLTSIGNYAFYGNQLTDLTFPDTLTTIGIWAFASNQLTDLTFPASLTTIGELAFADNPVATARFTGQAPELGAAALGSNDPTVRFPWKFGSPRTSGGYTAPTWNSYDTIAVSDVTFVAGDDIATRPVDVGDTASKPADPAKAGYVFTGWFADAATTPFDFTTPITGDITLTADFEAEAAPALEGPDLVTATLGADVSWTPTTLTGTPAPTVTATGLPDGLEIDSETGVVSGTVTDAALARDHAVTITASNGIDPDATLELTISIEGFTYSVADGKATITGYHGDAPVNLVIPAEIADGNGTYPVTAIGDRAFELNQLTALDLPETLTTIGDYAFQGNRLTELDLPSAFTTIGIWAFHGNRLTELDLPNTLTTISDYAFLGNRLTELNLPDTLTTISDYAFNDNQLTELDLPNTLTTIGAAAFQHNQLTELDLPDTLTSVSTHAFYDNQLTDLDLPDSVTTIGDGAFYSNQLAELPLPSALTTIGMRAFAYNQLTELTLPDSVTTIGDAAFHSNQLTALAVPASVTSIGEEAFTSNPELDDLRFVGAAPSLGDDALGTSDPTVRFRWKLGHPRAAGGFTTPLWHGYDTIAIADVSFVGGGDIAPQTVNVDATSVAVKPADPARAGYVFAGWFTNGATAAFDFTKPITGDTVLTARFADPAITGLAPAITGNPREGKTLTAKPGPVGPAGATVTYQWRADGQVIKGAAKPSLKLGKAHAGKRITVTITAIRATAPPVIKTSAKTKIVSSAKRRIVVSTRKVGKNQPVTVTATGFKARQKITIWLGKDKRYTGRADSRGIITKTIKFAKSTKAGTHRIRVTGHQAKGSRTRTVQTTVKYR